MGFFHRWCVLLAVGFAIQGCSARGGDSSSHPSSSDLTLSSIQIGPGTSQIAAGTIQKFNAIAIYSDGTKADVTNAVAWASSDPHVATVGNTPSDAGVSKALNPGAVQIKATLEEVSSTANLSVSSATLSKLQLSAPAGNIIVGTTQQLIATALFSDGTWQDVTESATWGSSDGSIATVEDLASSKGRTKGIAAGQTSVFASFASTPASIGLTVSAATLQKISLVPTASSLAKGTAVSVRAVATFSDNSAKDITDLSVWSSSNSAIVSTVTAPPLGQIAVGAGLGSAQLTAAYLGVNGSTSLTVTAATLDKLQIEPNQVTVAKGLRSRLKSVGIFSDGSKQDLTSMSIWISDGPDQVAVENSAQSAGLVTGIASGASTIRVKALNKAASSTVTVSAATPDQLSLWPVSQNLALGYSIPFTTAILLSDNTSQNVTTHSFWAVDDPTIAQLGISGRRGQSVSGLAVGDAVLSAVFQSKSASTPIHVTAATPTTLSITPSNSALAVGSSTQFKANVTFSDGRTQDVTSYVTWDSSLATSVTVSNADSTRGLSRGLASGTASITAQYLGLNATSSAVVSGASVSSIAVTPANPTLAKDASLKLAAVATLSDGSLLDITTDAAWGVTAESVASIGNLGKSSGRLLAQAQGDATITAKYAGVTGNTSLRVTSATLQTLSISPVAPSVAKNAIQTLTATAKFSDGSSLDVTDATTWKSSDAAVAAISNAEGSHGLAQGLSAGTATINAYYKKASASATLSVLPASITSIEVLPANPSVSVGLTQQFSATVHYSDSTSDDVTTLVSWGASNSSTATISNTAGSSGLAQAKAIGTTTISAIYGGHAGATVMTVTAAAP